MMIHPMISTRSVHGCAWAALLPASGCASHVVTHTDGVCLAQVKHLPDAYHLIASMINYDPAKRPTAQQVCWVMIHDLRTTGSATEIPLPFYPFQHRFLS
jgi:hypothetical protein